MWWLAFGACVSLASAANDSAVIFDKYTGEPVTSDNLNKFESAGITGVCTISIEQCDPSAGRRVDGACNSFDHPAKGTYQVPQGRVLPAHFYNGSQVRKAVSGEELTLPRVVSTSLLCRGQIASDEFTQSVPGFGIWLFGDVGFIHDILYFIANKTDCCEPEHMNDYMCTPNIYPDDDPVHRFSGIRCTNLTRPLDHQFLGCTEDIEPSPIAPTTAVIDLSQIYNALNGEDKAVRSYEGGELAVEVDENGTVWPPNGTSQGCVGNIVSQGETRCFANYGSPLLSITYMSIWLMRNHNLVARGLAKINPCWDDEKLFYTARDINIAMYAQIAYYEWLPTIVGVENAVSYGVISSYPGFRDIYDSNQYPLVSLEFLYALRWFHTAQEPLANKYYRNGTLKGSFRSTNLMFRPGFYGVDNNLEDYTQGMYRQNTAEIDFCVDPLMAEAGLDDHMQTSVDVTTSDLHKGRLLGMAPYIDYIEHFTGDKISTWEDLERHVSEERIDHLKLVYEDIRDIDLLAGIWSEKILKGGKIPTTLGYIFMDYLKKNVVSDRHWYERATRPYAFTAAQLLEIRKSTLALLICNNGDSVSEVQRLAFRAISPENPLIECSNYENIDFMAWADSTCSQCGA